jgi:mediator of RNA polymerase II transcription subunit 17
MTKKEGILEEMIRQAQHVVLRLRTMYVLDTLAKEIKDPLVVAHWASLNAVTHSCVRLTLLSSGYDMTARTPLVIHVKEKSLKCILKDGKAIHLSYEPQELRDIILSQIAIHQVMALQSLSKCMGWSVLSSSAHLGVGTCENLGNAAGCLLASPSGKRSLAIRSSPQNYHGGIQVFVGYPPGSSSSLLKDSMDIDTHFNPEPFNTDQPFESAEGILYKPIRLDKLEGKNFLNKMEMLMAVLADA